MLFKVEGSTKAKKEQRFSITGKTEKKLFFYTKHLARPEIDNII